MAKHKKTPVMQEQTLQNPVAKYMNRFNKARTHNDKTHYQRHRKHKNTDPFPIFVLQILETGSV